MKKKLNITRVAIVSLILLAIIMLIIIAIASNTKPSKKSKGKSNITISSEYNDMIIKDVEISYEEKAESTNIDFKIENTSNRDLQYESVLIMALDENNNVVSSVEQIIGFLEARGQYLVNITLLGNFEQQIKKIELQKPIE